jgi:hypothetical protein
MDVISTPDVYCPGMDYDGNYVDNILPIYIQANGVRCPCGTRKDHVYYTRNSFSSHMKSKTHIKWVSELNMNSMNHLSENIDLKELVDNQKLIIARLQKEVDANVRLIAHLTRKLEIKDVPEISTDLLIFS